MPKIDRYLRMIVDKKASDLHLTTSLRPHLRLDGSIEPVDTLEPLSPDVLDALLREIAPESNMEEFERLNDTDFAYEIDGVARFRVNLFRDNRGVGAVVRQIPSRIPTADDLGLPEAVRSLCTLNKGLVVVTGPTGSGKSTTLAAMIDLINKTRSEHIITIEDPIEFVHQKQCCLINQREVHVHTRSFAHALRAALREDPDIVLVGEMRDLETIETAIETAETGHLVFGTLHTNTAVSTVDRIVDKFPSERQNQIRTMLAGSLRGVVAQTLCKRNGGGRVAAMEILIVTPAVASNIRDGKTFNIFSAMQTGKRLGMQVMDDALLKLAVDKQISGAEALTKAMDRPALRKKLVQAGIMIGSTEEEFAKTPTEQEEGTSDRCAEDRARLQEWDKMLRDNAQCWEALNNTAWVLATSPCDSVRDGATAVSFAERARTCKDANIDEISVMDTLSAAYAENRQFDKAVQCAEEGLALAERGGRQDSAELIRKALTFYRSGKPFRDV